MCVALPGRVKAIGERTEFSIPGEVAFADGTAEVDLIMVPDATIGSYVIVHSGYALSVVPSDEAEATIELARH